MKIKNVFMFLLCFLSINIGAQDVDEILNNHFENTGGIENWKNLKNQVMTVKMDMGGMEFPGTITSASPNYQKMEMDIQGKQFLQAFDGETAWTINPFVSGADAQKMTDEEAAEIVDKTFESEFIDYSEKGHKVEFLGKEEVEGAETFILQLTKKNGDVETYYFETENFVPIKVTAAMKSGPAKGQIMETTMSDYQEAGDFIIPYYMETKMGGQVFQKMTVEKVDFNVELDNTIFAFPTKIEGEQAPSEEVKDATEETPSKGIRMEKSEEVIEDVKENATELKEKAIDKATGDQ